MADDLIAVGGNLEPKTLLAAYARGAFPWYGHNQPILWWSPNPRMVLHPNKFKIHTSLRKSLRRFTRDPTCAVHMNKDFAATIQACTDQSRKGQDGTWIHPEMQAAYIQLHRMGHAFSVETWNAEGLIGGLYGVVIGRAVFGESMFSRVTDASKIALAALVSVCMRAQIDCIDCQQNTTHLQRLGATTMPRHAFIQHLQCNAKLPTPLELVQNNALSALGPYAFA